MGKMGNGYGSEFHLLRYLGYHRNELNRKVTEKTGGKVIEWCDFGFGGDEKFDSERSGVDFLGSTSNVKSAYLNFWPQTGNVPNWDAVGLLGSDLGNELLLVEAKAHVEELRSSCAAKKAGGLGMIRKALEATIEAIGFDAKVEDWLSPYYQYANRLAHLHFLLQNEVLARLVFIYFCGDNWRGNKLRNGKPPVCPKDESEWSAPLNEMYDHLGLHDRSKLEERVHKVFLDVSPRPSPPPSV